jgi:curved DNA-binding protein CbpA
MAAADHNAPDPDHYQLLGVAPGASREEIAQAWRRRARAEHPDRQPSETGDEAAGRFRILAEAYRVLSDPARRAAYDRSLGGGQPGAGMPPPVAVPVRVIRSDGKPGPGGTPEPRRVPGPPLRAGPVRVEGRYGVPASGPEQQDIRLAILAAMALRYRARYRDWAW